MQHVFAESKALVVVVVCALGLLVNLLHKSQLGRNGHVVPRLFPMGYGQQATLNVTVESKEANPMPLLKLKVDRSSEKVTFCIFLVRL